MLTITRVAICAEMARFAFVNAGIFTDDAAVLNNSGVFNNARIGIRRLILFIRPAAGGPRNRKCKY